jgi:hypothetical protein
MDRKANWTTWTGKKRGSFSMKGSVRIAAHIATSMRACVGHVTV